MKNTAQIPRYSDLSMDPVFGTLPQHWGWMLALGIVSIILGTIGLGMSIMLSIVGTLMFGVLLLVGAGLQLFQSFKAKGWKSTLPHVLIGLIYLAVGGLIIIDPLGATIALTLLLGMALLIVGILRLSMAMQHRGVSGWGWVLASGIASLLLGVMVIVGWPFTGLWVIGLFIAIELIVNGWSYIVLSQLARRYRKV